MKQAFLKSTFLVMAATALLRSLGFFREMTLAAVYGAGMVTDAFVIAYNTPATVLAFVSAAMGTIYIPLYQSNKERKDFFTSNMINLLALIGLVFTLLFTFFPKALVFVFASQLDAETFELTAMMTSIMVWTAVPILLMSIYRGYLEMHGAFFNAQIAYGTVNTCVIAAIVLSGATQYLPILGIGAIAGNLLCIIILHASSRRHGLRYRPYLNFRDGTIRDVLILAAPVVIATGITEINQIVDRNFASTLPTGAISSLNYANKLIGLAAALIGMAVATVLFPKMSELAAGSNFASLKKYLMGCVKKLVPLLLPLTAGTIILSAPIIRILFERGAFTAGDTQRTAECLQMYAICIFCSSISALMLRACHAMKNMKGPAVCSAVAVAFNIALNFLLVAPFGHRGLAISTGAASVVTMVSLAVILRHQLGLLGLRSEMREIFKAILATIVMSAGVWAGVCFLPVMSGGFAQCTLLTAGLVLGGIGVYLAMHLLLRTVFLRDTRELIKLLIASLRLH